MPEASSPATAVVKCEDLLPLFASLNNQLKEAASHIEDYENSWRLLVRLLLTMSWLRASGTEQPHDLTDELKAIPEELTNADRDLLKQTASLKLRINDLKRRVAEFATAARKSLGSGSPQIEPVEGWNDPIHETNLRMVLCREELVPANEKLPKPSETPEGVAGRSSNYLLRVAHHHQTRTVFAKFDEPDRAQREWLAIERLIHLPLPRAFILPLRTNQPGDGVIVSEAAATPRTKGCQTLVRYLRDQLASALGNCRHALEGTIAPLAEFYALKVRSDDTVGRSREVWLEVFPNLMSQLNLFADAAQRPSWKDGEPVDRRWFEAAEHFWPKIGWQSERVPLHEGEDCYNPIWAALRMLNNPVEAYFKRSRVHGDLNLTNLLVCPTEDSTPDAVYVIDFANFEESQVTATDLARLEAAFWHEVYFPHAMDKPNLLEQYGKALEYIDGKIEKNTLTDDVTRRSAELALCIRKLAFKILRPEDKERAANYIFQDYFHCLYFSHLFFIGWKTVFQSSKQVCLSLAGAAAALGMVRERNRFSAGADKSFFRPWEESG